MSKPARPVLPALGCLVAAALFAVGAGSAETDTGHRSESSGHGTAVVASGAGQATPDNWGWD